MLASVKKDNNILMYKVQEEARGTRERRSMWGSLRLASIMKVEAA